VGIDIIIIGDFYQFPPVIHNKQALYMPMRTKESNDECISHQIYQQFEKTNILEEQMRTDDPEWIDGLIFSNMLDMGHAPQIISNY
jgi:hypothetical protein